MAPLPRGMGHSTPFLTVPTSCEGPQEFSIETENTRGEQQHPPHARQFVTHDQTGTQVGFTGCDHLNFAPAISVAPDTSHADTPAGLTVEVEAPRLAVDAPEGFGHRRYQEHDGDAARRADDQPGAGHRSGCVPSQPRTAAAAKVRRLPGGLESRARSKSKRRCSRHARRVTSTCCNPAAEPASCSSPPPGKAWNLKLIGDVHLETVTGQPDHDVRGYPRAAVHGLQAVLQRWRAGGAGDADASGGPYLGGVAISRRGAAPVQPLTISCSATSFDVTAGPRGVPCSARRCRSPLS